MKMPVITLVGWQKRFGTEKACAKILANVRWPQGFQCPACGSQKYSIIATRKLYQCSSCRHQVSVTADTLFHATKVPLVKWFWAIYLTASDKGAGFVAMKAVGTVSKETVSSFLPYATRADSANRCFSSTECRSGKSHS